MCPSVCWYKLVGEGSRPALMFLKHLLWARNGADLTGVPGEVGTSLLIPIHTEPRLRLRVQEEHAVMGVIPVDYPKVTLTSNIDTVNTGPPLASTGTPAGCRELE